MRMSTCPMSTELYVACSRLSDSGEDAKVKTFFLAPSSQGRSCVPSSGLLCAGNLVNIRSAQKLSWISLFQARGRRMPSFWVIGKTRIESVDIIYRIWPIRGYTRSWYTGTGRLKKWLQAPLPLLPSVSSRFTFVFMLPQFSRPNHLGAWDRLRELGKHTKRDEPPQQQ